MPLSLGCCGGDGDDADASRSDAGIPKPRECTDLVWLIIFVIFCCVMVFIAAFALVYGNPKRLINGMDSFGNVCGSANEKFGNMTFSGLDMTDKPHVFYFNLQDMDRSTKVCVSDCPRTTLRNMGDLQDHLTNTSINLCRYDFNLSAWEDSMDVVRKAGRSPSKLDFSDILCPKFPVYSSLPVLKRCIPNPSERVKEEKMIYNVFGYLNNLNLFKQILGDLAVTWVTVLGLTGVSFVISLVLLVVLHWITAVVSYLILIFASLLSIGFTAFLWWTYVEIKQKLDSTNEDMILEEIAKNERAFLTYSIIATVFTIVLLLVVLVVRNRVSVVVKLFREAGSAMLSMPCLFLQPIITYVALTIFFCAWLYIVLCLATADYPTLRLIPSIPGDEPSLLMSETKADNNETIIADTTAVEADSTRRNKTISFEDISGWTLIEYSDGAWVKYTWFIYLVGLIWCSEFILACQQMVIASSVSTWYFSRNRNSLGCIVLNSITRMIKYHIGSVALGSLVITLIKLPRLILQFSQRVFRKWNDYEIVRCCSSGCSWFLSCLERGMKYVHHNAYTVISIQGVDFCPASRLAFSALTTNALQISVINSIGDFVLFLAKCITAALTGLIALWVFRSDDTLYFYAIPVLLTVVFSYFVAHCVISVFEMAVDTLFLCFCEDHNMSDGTDGKQLYAPKSLLKYMTEDAVDLVAPGRRVHSSSPMKKVPVDDVGATAEEIIPMNPYGETTTPND